MTRVFQGVKFILRTPLSLREFPQFHNSKSFKRSVAAGCCWEAARVISESTDYTSRLIGRIPQIPSQNPLMCPWGLQLPYWTRLHGHLLIEPFCFIADLPTLFCWCLITCEPLQTHYASPLTPDGRWLRSMGENWDMKKWRGTGLPINEPWSWETRKAQVTDLKHNPGIGIITTHAHSKDKETHKIPSPLLFCPSAGF